METWEAVETRSYLTRVNKIFLRRETPSASGSKPLVSHYYQCPTSCQGDLAFILRSHVNHRTTTVNFLVFTKAAQNQRVYNKLILGTWIPVRFGRPQSSNYFYQLLGDKWWFENQVFPRDLSNLLLPPPPSSSSSSSSNASLSGSRLSITLATSEPATSSKEVTQEVALIPSTQEPIPPQSVYTPLLGPTVFPPPSSTGSSDGDLLAHSEEPSTTMAPTSFPAEVMEAAVREVLQQIASGRINIPGAPNNQSFDPVAAQRNASVDPTIFDDIRILQMGQVLSKIEALEAAIFYNQSLIAAGKPPVLLTPKAIQSPSLALLPASLASTLNDRITACSYQCSRDLIKAQSVALANLKTLRDEFDNQWPNRSPTVNEAINLVVARRRQKPRNLPDAVTNPEGPINFFMAPSSEGSSIMVNPAIVRERSTGDRIPRSTGRQAPPQRGRSTSNPRYYNAPPDGRSNQQRVKDANEARAGRAPVANRTPVLPAPTTAPNNSALGARNRTTGFNVPANYASVFNGQQANDDE